MKNDNEIRLPAITINISEVQEYHKNPEKLLEKIQQKAGLFVFDISVGKGRDQCRTHAANVIRCISPAITASKEIAAEAKKVLDADLNFRKKFETGVREIAENIRKPLTEWEKEQAHIEEEKARAEAEEAEKLRFEQQYETDWNEALVFDEIFTLRKEKSERDAKEQVEREAKAKADYERQLQEQAVDREREKQAEVQRQREAEQKRETERAEQQRLDAIAKAERAEKEKLEAIERAEREKLIAEQRAEQARQAAERDAKAREQAAIENERKRQEAQAKAKADEQARIKAEADKQAENKAHRQAINKEILTKLLELGASEQLAKAIIISAAKGLAGNLIIKY